MTDELTPFAGLIVETRDGEWGEGQETPGHVLCEVVRGTDFAHLHTPGIELPRRWVPEHLVARKALQAGDILIETAGGTANQSTGRTALVTAAFLARRQGAPVLCSSFARHLRVDRTKVCPEYLYYVLQALYRAGYMAVFNLQHTGISRFQFTSFKNKTVLRLRSVHEQVAVAAILTTYDELISNNQRRIALLETMADEVYREWFVRMRFPDHDRVSVKRGLPASWSLVPIRQVVRHYIGGGWGEDEASSGSPEGAYVIRGTDIPRLAAGQLGNGVFRFHKSSSLKSRLLEAGDFVFEVSGGSKDQLLGRNLMVTQSLLEHFGGRAICASFCKLIRLDTERVSPYLMRYFLKLYYETGLVGLYQVQSTGISNYQFEAFLSRQTIALPPRALQTAFETLARPFLDQRDVLAKSNLGLRRARDALMPRLISGKLQVDPLDIDIRRSMETVAPTHSRA